MIIFFTQQFLMRSMKAFLKFLNSLGIKRTPSHYYFGYGANLDANRFKKLQMSVREVGPAILKDFELNFSLQCQYKNMGFANVTPQQASSVYGFLYQLDRLSLLLLDILEFVPFGVYRRVSLEVETGTGEKYQAAVLVARRPGVGLKPTSRYLDLLVNASIKNGFPSSYVDRLKEMETLKTIEIDHEFTLLTKSRKRFFVNRLRPFYVQQDRWQERILAYLRKWD